MGAEVFDPSRNLPMDTTTLREWLPTIGDRGHQQIVQRLIRAIEMANADSVQIGELKALADRLSGAVTTADVTHATMNAVTKAVDDRVTGLAATVDGLVARIVALEARKVTLAAKSTALPLLALGGSTDVTVTWGKNLGDANYQVEFLVDAPLIGKVTPTVKTTYATSCIVTVKSTIALALGQSFDAIASRYA